MPANTGFTSGQVLTAQQMTNLPWGLVQTTSGGTSSRGYKEIATGQTVNAGNTADITDSSMTFTGVTGRIYCYTITSYMSSTSASGMATVIIADGSNNQKTAVSVNLTNAAGASHMVARYIFTATGSTTVKARLSSITGNSTIFGATTPGYISLEDLGPST